ncbi:MAG: hypothetical protein H6852_08970 [Geminicoccaceae bacterium]|nr:hypothetical protein [Geminicoccaceae bacterium]MCB9967750.1 hypothetical protein [Geminicoccaceae bacterium]HRY26231.1 hypothetical protein [Geminicoccaceae bacterium]
MSPDQLFGLVAMTALLIWLGRGFLPHRHHKTMERLAMALIGGGILVALAFTVLHFSS